VVDAAGDREMKDLIKKIDRLAEMVSELKQQLQGEDEPDTSSIDWSKMPKGTLVIGENGLIYVFSHAINSEEVSVYEHGRCHLTTPHPTKVLANPQLAKGQPWKPWFGDECPVDHGVNVDYMLRSAWSDEDFHSSKAGERRWNWAATHHDTDITAWRISDKQETEK
jgi:hypothetical protein